MRGRILSIAFYLYMPLLIIAAQGVWRLLAVAILIGNIIGDFHVARRRAEARHYERLKADNVVNLKNYGS